MMVVNFWRKVEMLKSKNLNNTVKHGGGCLMVSGAMGANFVDNIEKIMKKLTNCQ